MIFADAPHCAFPMALSLAGGRQLVTYRAATRHEYDADGRVLVRHSDDDGATWSPARDLCNCIGDDRSAVMAEYGDAVVAAIYVLPQPSLAGIYSESRISHDGGLTWGAPRTMTFGHASWSVATGLVVTGGRLLAAAYGSDNSDGRGQYVTTATSVDGKTWAPGSVIATGGGNWQEPALIDTPHGVACFLRYENGAERRIYVAWSHDGGVTWGTPVLALELAGGQPAPYMAPDGRMALAFRDHSNGQETCGLATSVDGQSWTRHGNWAGSSLRYVYAGWMNRTNGASPLIAYGLESGEYAATVRVEPITLPAPPPPPEPPPLHIAIPTAATFPIIIDRAGTTYRGNATATVEGDTLSVGIFASQPRYREEVLADSPLLYWRLGESSGTTAADQTTNGYNGTYQGTHTLGQTGAISDGNLAVYLVSGNQAKVVITDAAWMDVTDLSIEYWVRRAGKPSGDVCTCSRYSTADPSGSSFIGFLFSTGLVRMDVRDSSNNYVNGAASTTNVADNTWHHVVHTVKSGDKLVTYVDGEEEHSVSFTGKTLRTGSINFTVGPTANEQLGPSPIYFDEVAYYGTALSPARVAAHFAAAA